MAGSRQRGKARAARTAEGKVAYFDEAGDMGWWVQSDGSQHSLEEDIHLCLLSARKMQNQRHEAHRKKDAERGWTQGEFKNVQGEESTHNKRYQALSILETIREEDEAEEPTYVFDKSDNGKWIREEAVVDSCAVECVTSKKRMPHVRVQETPESRRGETWTCAGGIEIKKEGKVTVNWRTKCREH